MGCVACGLVAPPGVGPVLPARGFSCEGGRQDFPQRRGGRVAEGWGALAHQRGGRLRSEERASEGGGPVGGGAGLECRRRGCPNHHLFPSLCIRGGGRVVPTLDHNWNGAGRRSDAEARGRGPGPDAGPGTPPAYTHGHSHTLPIHGHTRIHTSTDTSVHTLTCSTPQTSGRSNTRTKPSPQECGHR